MDSVPVYVRGIDSHNERFAEMTRSTGRVPRASYIDVGQSLCIGSQLATHHSDGNTRSGNAQCR